MRGIAIEQWGRVMRMPAVLAASLLFAGTLLACGSQADCSDMIPRRSGFELEPIPNAQAGVVPMSPDQASDAAVRHGAGVADVVDVCLGLLIQTDRFSGEVVSSRPTYQVRLAGQAYRAYLVDAVDASRVFYATASSFSPAP